MMLLHVLAGNKQDVDLFGHVITNQESCDITITALGVRFLVPAKSSFLLSDMSKIELLTVSHDAPQYSLLVMDPPWENRSAIRGKKLVPMKYGVIVHVCLMHDDICEHTGAVHACFM